MELELTKVEVKEGIGILAMNNIKTYNAFNAQSIAEFNYAFTQLEEDPEVKVIVIKGLPKAFSSGGDVSTFYALNNSGGEVPDVSESVKGNINIPVRMKKCPKVVITSVSGAAAGAGASVALAGDYVLMSDTAFIMVAFAQIAHVPDTGVTYLLSKSIGTHRAFRLCAQAGTIKAPEALELGIAEKVVPVDELDEVTFKFAKKVAAGPLWVYKSIKEQMYEINYKDLEHYINEVEFPLIMKCEYESKDFVEGVNAFVEKRKPVYTGKIDL